MKNEKKFPPTVVGLYANQYDSTLNSQVLTQEYADKACAAIQQAVGGKLSVKAVKAETKESKGDKFPDFFIEAVTAEILAERKAWGEQRKAQRVAISDGDNSL